MDYQMLLTAVDQFFRDARFYTILGLIALDVALAVAEAIKENRFDWHKLGEFYRSMVVPYVLGYMAVYVAITYIPGDVGSILGEAVRLLGFAGVLSTLAASIVGHAKAIAPSGPPAPPRRMRYV